MPTIADAMRQQAEVIDTADIVREAILQIVYDQPDSIDLLGLLSQTRRAETAHFQGWCRPMQLSRASAICGIVGLTLFVAGFFLPAVRFPPDPRPEAHWGPGTTSHEFPGYVCAEITLLGSATFFEHPKAEAIPAVVSGWINPLVLLYLVACLAKCLNRTRLFVAVAIAACCLAMWIQLATEHVALLVGHYFWIAGIASLLFAPLVNRRSQRNDSKAESVQSSSH
jgi:hypothetical protein